MPRQLRCCCVGTWSWGSWGWSLAGRRRRRWTSLSTTGRHQRWRISRRSDDNDSWMRTGSGRRGGGGGEHSWTRTGRRGSWRTRMSGGWPPARPAPPLTLDRLHPADSETVPCWGRRRPSVRRDTAADSASGAAGVAGYAVFPLPSPQPGPYGTVYVQCESLLPPPESNGDIIITLMALLLPNLTLTI